MCVWAGTGVDDEVRLGVELSNGLHHQVQGNQGKVAVEVAIVTSWTLREGEGVHMSDFIYGKEKVVETAHFWERMSGAYRAIVPAATAEVEITVTGGPLGARERALATTSATIYVPLRIAGRGGCLITEGKRLGLHLSSPHPRQLCLSSETSSEEVELLWLPVSWSSSPSGERGEGEREG